MFVELIATIVAGLAAAGVIMLINKTLRGRLPRWFVPIGAGAAMLLVTISNEYGWYSRTKNALPEGLVIAQTVENKAFFRPWTYVQPFVERFVAIDTLTLQTHPAQPGIRLAEVYFFGRWSPVNKVPVLADCPAHKRAALTDAFAFENNGRVSGVQWIDVAANDPVVSAICGAG